MNDLKKRFESKSFDSFTTNTRPFSQNKEVLVLCFVVDTFGVHGLLCYRLSFSYVGWLSICVCELIIIDVLFLCVWIQVVHDFERGTGISSIMNMFGGSGRISNSGKFRTSFPLGSSTSMDEAPVQLRELRRRSEGGNVSEENHAATHRYGSVFVFVTLLIVFTFLQFQFV